MRTYIILGSNFIADDDDDDEEETRTGTPLENSRERAGRGRPANDNVCKVDDIVSPMALNPCHWWPALVDGATRGATSIARFSRWILNLREIKRFISLINKAWCRPELVKASAFLKKTLCEFVNRYNRAPIERETAPWTSRFAIRRVFKSKRNLKKEKLGFRVV